MKVKPGRRALTAPTLPTAQGPIGFLYRADGIGDRIRLQLQSDGARICLTVSDTGPGIPEAAREAVFEPFHRLDPSRSKPGSGLGLAFVRAIADRHGARITLADNAPGLRVVVQFAAADAA